MKWSGTDSIANVSLFVLFVFLPKHFLEELCLKELALLH